MPTISLVPTACSFHVMSGDRSKELRMIGVKEDDGRFEPKFEQGFWYSVVLEKPRWNTVHLTTNEKFTDLEGIVRVTRIEPGDRVEKQIGKLHYLEASHDDLLPQAASYNATVLVSAHQYDELLAVARVGRLPSDISLTMVGQGIEYGSMPDGSDVKWDNKQFPILSVSKADFLVKYVVAAVPDDEKTHENRVLELSLPPTRAQVEKITSLISFIPKLIFWLTMGIVVVLFIAKR